MGPETAHTIVFRVDADLSIGSGHMMRCIALAQAARDKANRRCIFFTRKLLPPLIERLRDERFEHLDVTSEAGSVGDAAELRSIAGSVDADWIVLDGYQFSADFERMARKAGHRLLVIRDDGISAAHAADIVLNANLHARASFYEDSNERAVLLIGPQYALIRSEFLKPFTKRIFPAAAQRLLVTLGGSDANQFTRTALKALQNLALDGYCAEVAVVLGPMNEQFDVLRREPFPSNWKVKILRDVRDMAELMQWADLAISSSGATTWELAALGVPSIVIPIADNQVPVARTLGEIGAVVALPDWSSTALLVKTLTQLIRDPARRKELSRNAQRLVDGGGTARVLHAMDSIPDDLVLRDAVEADSRQLWTWANEPAVREHSFSSDPIPWETHSSWIAHVLTDPTYQLLVAANAAGENIGLVRFRIYQETATISINLGAESRRKGFGRRLICKATRQLFQTTKVATIMALIKPGNIASLNAFRGAGFEERGCSMVSGQSAIRMEINRCAKT